MSDTDQIDQTELEQTPEEVAEYAARERELLEGSPLRAAPTLVGPPPPSASPSLRRAESPTPPSWDLVATARPAEYVQALEALEVAAEAVNEMIDRIQALPEDRAEYEARLQAEAIAADRDGRAPKLPRKRDWDQERAVLEAQYRGRYATFSAARATYRSVLKDTKAKWLDSLVSEHAGSLAAVRKAVHAAQQVLQPLHDHWGLLVGIGYLADEVSSRMAPSPGSLRALTAPAQALRDAQALLDSEDPAITLTWLTDQLEPPMLEREHMFNSGGEGGLLALLEIELAEGFEHSSFTKALAVAQGRWGSVAYTPSGQRFLAV